MPGKTGKRSKAPSPCAGCGANLRGGTFNRRKDGDWCHACYDARFMGKLVAAVKFPGLPREEVSCPACGKIYGYSETSVCKGCEECSKCCRCKTGRRVLVDAQTFVNGLAETEGRGRQVGGNCPVVANLTPTCPSYPEHDKLRPYVDKTNFTMEFIKEHCEPKGVFLSDKDGRAVCVEDLLYEFIEVDRWKLEDEKRAMVDSLQNET